MCAIAGIHAYHYAANGVERSELIAIRDHMASRGPDGSGLWLSPDARIGLGHRRLAIIDLTDNAAQPMQSEDGQLVVTFNGEIYNYASLRTALIAKGYHFRTASDTEVLLHLYADRGQAMLSDLRGMFAFAIWDARTGVTLLARDPYGIKPLYYSDDGWTCRFASQVKALLAGGAISRERDPAGQVGFFLFGSVPEPFTSYLNIRAVPAGTLVRIERTGPGQPQRYHSIAAIYAASARPALSPNDLARDVRAALLDSVRTHLVSDVPVGAFLSAGIDSGALVGLMRDAGAAKIETVTIGFEEYSGHSHDEAPLAAKVARHYETTHSTHVVTRAEFEADLPRIVDAMDQPTIDGINTWFVAKAARERGLKVAISGLGGDELFGGYPSFRDLPRWVGRCALPARIPFLGKLSRTILSGIVGQLGLNPKSAGMLELGGTYAGAYLLRRGLFMPWELNRVLDRETRVEGMRRLKPLAAVASELGARPRDAFGRVATLESTLYMRNQLLRDTDWASMAHSLEVRTPLVDSVLLSEVAPLLRSAALGSGKQMLAQSPSKPLPPEIADRAKTGFTTPIGQWMRAQIKSRPATPATSPPSEPWARGWSRIVAGSYP